MAFLFERIVLIVERMADSKEIDQCFDAFPDPWKRTQESLVLRSSQGTIRIRLFEISSGLEGLLFVGLLPATLLL